MVTMRVLVVMRDLPFLCIGRCSGDVELDMQLVRVHI
jgi:hypothetical protein